MSAHESHSSAYPITDFLAFDLTYWSAILKMSASQRLRARQDVERLHTDILLCMCAAMDRQLYRFRDANPRLADLVDLLDGGENEIAVKGLNATIRLTRRRGTIIVGHITLDARH